MSANPADVAKAIYEENRSNTLAQLPPEDADKAGPTWDEMEERQKEPLISSMTEVMQVLQNNRFDIVEIPS